MAATTAPPADVQADDTEPTLDDLRARVAELQERIEEQRRAEVAHARDRALATWKRTRATVQHQVDQAVAKMALQLLDGDGLNARDLADLTVLASDGLDRLMREKIEVAVESRLRHRHQGHVPSPAERETARLTAEIARREKADAPTGAQLRQQRLLAKVAAQSQEEAA